MSVGSVRTELSDFLRGMRAAVVFLTRVRVGGFPFSAAEWGWAPAHFPLVGAVLGTVLAAVYWAALPALGASVASCLTLAVGLLATGAFHEDGLADTSDALFGFGSRERLFEILKDSRLGTYGVSALAVTFLWRVAALSELGSAAPVALVWAHCWARVAPVWQLTLLPYVSPVAAAKSRDLEASGLPQALVGLLWAALLGGLLYHLKLVSPPALLTAAVCLVGLTLWLSRCYRQRLGGVVGDVLGATEQLGEVLILTVALYFSRA